MSTDLAVSVVVPSCGHRASVERLLAAFTRQTLPPEEFEVIVALNGADDGTAAMIDRLHVPFRLRYTWSEQRSRSSACNAGARVAAGRLLVFLDDDMEPVPEFLRSHLAAHASGGPLGVVGAAPIHFDKSSPPIVRYRGKGFQHKLEGIAATSSSLRFTQVYTGNFSIPRELFLEVDGFDEEFQLYGYEDYEMVLRLLKRGVHFSFSPHALAVQSYDKDFAGLAASTISQGKMAVLFVRKHPEVFHELDLGHYHTRSRPRRYLRKAMLGASRLWHGFPSALIRTVAWIESRRPGRLFAHYSFLLDFCYWHGVDSALRPAGRDARAPLSLGRRLQGLAQGG